MIHQTNFYGFDLYTDNVKLADILNSGIKDGPNGTVNRMETEFPGLQNAYVQCSREIGAKQVRAEILMYINFHMVAFAGHQFSMAPSTPVRYVPPGYDVEDEIKVKPLEKMVSWRSSETIAVEDASHPLSLKERIAEADANRAELGGVLEEQLKDRLEQKPVAILTIFATYVQDRKNGGFDLRTISQEMVCQMMRRQIGLWTMKAPENLKLAQQCLSRELQNLLELPAE
jgi:hypothetical protein